MYITEQDLEKELNNASDAKVTIIDKQKNNILKDVASKIFEINLQNAIFTTLQFPSLPRNWQFYMTPIQWPAKLKNVNDSLFANPNVIDNDDAHDLAMQCFGGERFDGAKTGLKMTLQPKAYDDGKEKNEAYIFDFNKVLVSLILEDTPSMTGADMEVKDVKSNNKNMSSMSTDIVKAITSYISRSIQAIKPLIEMTGGAGALKGVMQAINTANAASYKNVSQWLEKKSAVKKESAEMFRSQRVEIYKSQTSFIKKAAVFAQCLFASEVPGGMTKDEFIKQVTDEVTGVEDKTDLMRFMLLYTTKWNGDYDKFLRDFNAHGGKPFPIDITVRSKTEESIIADFGKHINEVLEDPEDKIDEDILDTTPIDYDQIYNDLFITLSSAMSDAIGARADWLCFKNVAEQMKYLKDAANKEINAKIDLVCNTTGQENKLQLKYPFKAEGLKGMWARYDAELQMRIDNRINYLQGSQGGAETGTAAMVEDFLRTTYPQIIAMMITYRCVFAQIAEQYRNGYVPAYTLEDVQELIAAQEKEYSDDIDVAFEGWDEM